MFTQFTIFGRRKDDDRVDKELNKNIYLNINLVEYLSLDVEGYRILRMNSGTYYTIEDSHENREKLGL